MRTSKAEIRRVVLYARVSTTEQAEKDLSLPARLATLRRMAADRSYVVADEYVEPGASGRDDQRPIFRQMMQAVLAPSGKVDAILVVHTSRFMRDVGKAVVHKQALARRGIRVLSASQETADDPSGHLMETIYAGFDQYESEMNGYRTTAAMRENARRGFINGSLAPFGFCARRVDVGGGPKRRKLFPETTEVEMVREIFRLYIGHRGAKAVARELNQRGLRYRGGKLWTKDCVLRIIEETAAVGTYNWGKADSRTGKVRDRSEWIAIAVDPIIDRDLFEAAQRVRESRDPRRVPGRTSSSPLMLAGLIKCGECGARYVLETSGKADPEGEHTYRYYNCRSFVKTGKEACPGRRIPIKKLDRAVLEHLADQIFSVDRCRALVRDIVEETGILRQKTDEQRRDLQRQIENINGRIAKWEEAFETNAEAADVIMPKLRELRQKRDEIASTIAKIFPLRPPPSHLYSAATIQRFQDTVRQLLLSDDPTLAKNYLRFLVDQIVVRGNEVEIRGRTQAAVALLSAGSEGTCLATANRPAEVLTSVGGWLPIRSATPTKFSGRPKRFNSFSG